LIVTVKVHCEHCQQWTKVPADRFMLQINPVDGRLEYECVCTRCSETTCGVIPPGLDSTMLDSGAPLTVR
jgi:hypothetical protein